MTSEPQTAALLGLPAGAPAGSPSEADNQRQIVFVESSQPSSSSPPYPNRPLGSSSHHSTLRQVPFTSKPSNLSSNPSHSGGNKDAGAVSSAKRLYRASAGENKFVTRDIAALDFLLGIPLAAEANIVQEGWVLHRQKQQDDATRDRYLQHEASSLSAYSHHYPAESEQSATVSQGTWWGKYVQSMPDPLLQSPHNDGLIVSPMHSDKHSKAEEAELERPNQVQFPSKTETSAHNGGVILPAHTPGRRLDGDEAVRIQIPITTVALTQRTKQKSIARTAAIREWERQTAHGLVDHPPLLDGRIFFSASGSYPVSVCSIIRYEPKREQAEFLRKKLESLGGGGSQFVMPVRDWRGISYRALLPRRRRRAKQDETSHFNRFVRSTSTGSTKNTKDISQKPKTIEEGRQSEAQSSQIDKEDTGDHEEDKGEADENESLQSSSEDEESSDEYEPGILDDVNMVLGRHRNVMIGDYITGPVISSTIQFVKPALLKAELNKQFRERFDGWEPPKAARKYIGAYVSIQEGRYVLHDPTEDTANTSSANANTSGVTTDEARASRKRLGSVTSLSSASEVAGPKEKPALRIPPSLTLSKIRSIKQQALTAAVRAQLEISTVALACVYFERLCLHCRVDKSNRRLSFAACLLIAAKLNEPNVGLVMMSNDDTPGKQKPTDPEIRPSVQSLGTLIKPNNRSNNMFASLLEFFTEDWSLSVKRLLDAEWGVFAALGFSLHATPSQVAFHFKRLMKTLEWNPCHYLGPVMWEQWQDCLEEEERRKREKSRRKEIKRQRKEERLLNLQLELENEVLRRQKQTGGDRRVDTGSSSKVKEQNKASETESRAEKQSEKSIVHAPGGLKLFNRFALRRTRSVDRLVPVSEALNAPPSSTALSSSPSMPIFPRTLDTESTVVIERQRQVVDSDDGTASSDMIDDSGLGGVMIG